MSVQTYDFRTFCQGELVHTKKPLPKKPDSLFFSAGAYLAYTDHYPHAVPAAGNIQAAFDPIIAMLQSMAYPVAFTCIAWACLEAMIGKPASAVSRAKWAIIGYLAMRYVPALLRSI